MRATAVATSGADAASIGRTGRPGTSPNRSSAARPPSRAARATSPDEGVNIAARRTAVTGTPAARAIPSSRIESWAPWRRFSKTSARRNGCSSAVARPKSVLTSPARVVRDPGPATRLIASSASSTSVTVSEGESVGVGRSASPRHPRPVRR